MLAPSPNVVWQQETARDLSLTEMLSLSDWRRFVPETIGLLVMLALVSTALTDRGSVPSAFWIPVLLMSSQYGIMGGLFSAILASVVLYINGLPPQSAGQDFYAYAAMVATQPSAWFATALVLGGLRTLHIHHETTLKHQLERTQRAGEDLADGLERAMKQLERLEQRIASDTGTLASLLNSLAKLEMRDPRSLIGSMADVVRYGVGASSFAIYLRTLNGPEPCLGIQDGVRLTPEAIPPLEPNLARLLAGRGFGADPTADDADTNCSLWEVIRLQGSTEPLGIMVCRRLMPSRDPAIARRRLHEICGVLAVLLSTCPGQAKTCPKAHGDRVLALEVC